MGSGADVQPAAVRVIACGALAREIAWVVSVNGLTNVAVDYLPARLHNTPRDIPALVDEWLERAPEGETRFVAYGDCGTGGLLDEVLDRHGVERLAGAHCYQFFAGELFDELAAAEPGTFYLTDYLARHFDRLVWQGLGLDRHPGLRDTVFANYRRLVYLAQRPNARLLGEARAAAERLGLEFEVHEVGLGSLEPRLVSIATSATP